MPCAAGSFCKLLPDHTPGPPLFTSHRCRVCGGYLHGLCGVPDPLGASEMQRVCDRCINSAKRKESSTDPDAWAAYSKRDCPTGKGKGKDKQVDAEGSLKRVGKTPPRKARGSENRTRATFREQVEALDLLKTMTGTAVAAKLNIGVSTLYSWKAKEADIRKRAAESKPDAKSTKGSDFWQVERQVLEMVEEARALKLPVNRGSIQSFGRKACRVLKDAASTDAERKRYSDFTVSEGWVKKFVKRHNLNSRGLNGEADGVDDEVIAAGITRVREMCAEYDLDCIYNVDETKLFYKVLPKVSYLTPTEDRKATRVVKDMKARDRLIAYICTNASGRKVPLSLIGKSKDPPCFRIQQSPVKYFSQKNAWSDAPVFQQWWLEVFLPHVRCVTSKKVLLIMDSHSSHADLVDPRKQVTILELPPKCKSKHQPMDAGIIQAWKMRYRTSLLRVRVNTMSSAEQLQRQAKERKVVRGCMGLAEGSQPHILDAAELGVKAWHEVSEETIMRRKSDILSPAMHASIDRDVGKNTNRQESLGGLEELVQRLSLGVARGNVDKDLGEALEGLRLAPGAKPTQASMCAVEAWFGVEDHEDVARAIIEDLKDDLFEESLTEQNGESDDDEANSLAAGNGPCTPPAPSPRPPPYREVASQFGDLEEVAERCNMAEVSYYLRKAKLAWMDEYGAMQTKQTCMANFL